VEAPILVRSEIPTEAGAYRLQLPAVETVAVFDREYVEAIQRWDPEVEAHFTSYFGKLIDLKVRSRLRSSEAIEDVRQETFFRVFRTLRVREFEHPERLGAFVNTVCSNVLSEYIRAESRRMRSLLPEDADVLTADDAPDEQMRSEESRLIVRQILDQLPERDRRLLRAVFLEERDKDEIVKAFGVDRDYLRVLLHRAKHKFRAALEKVRGKPDIIPEA
jgi:RNA polymerase sigma-70 factor (ECF subfamily)